MKSDLHYRRKKEEHFCSSKPTSSSSIIFEVVVGAGLGGGIGVQGGVAPEWNSFKTFEKTLRWTRAAFVSLRWWLRSFFCTFSLHHFNRHSNCSGRNTKWSYFFSHVLQSFEHSCNFRLNERSSLLLGDETNCSPSLTNSINSSSVDESRLVSFRREILLLKSPSIPPPNDEFHPKKIMLRIPVRIRAKSFFNGRLGRFLSSRERMMPTAFAEVTSGARANQDLYILIFK